MRHTGGTWFGWSGETSVDPAPAPQILSRDGIRFTTIDLRPQDFELYYNGYCNSTLWPLFHYFTARFVHEQAQHDAYQNVNAQFASQLAPLLSPDDVVWVHDYHLIPLARQLRERGFEGPIGFFLHPAATRTLSARSSRPSSSSTKARTKATARFIAFPARSILRASWTC